MREPTRLYPGVSCFTRHEDGSTTVDDWYRELPFSERLLDEWRAKPSMIITICSEPKYLDSLLFIEVANGRAIYRLGELDPQTMTRIGTLIQAEIDDPAE